MEKKTDAKKSGAKKSASAGTNELPTPRPFKDSRMEHEKLGMLTEKIIAAKNLDGILIDLKEEMNDFFRCKRITVYIIDGVKVELVSRFMSKSEISEIRLPISKGSIAGYTALTQRSVAIKDVTNNKELKAVDPDLEFDDDWDKKTGFTTRQVLAVPIIVRHYLMGVLQLMNRKDGYFDNSDERTAIEMARIIGVALYNQKRTARLSNNKFSYLIHSRRITPKDLHSAVAEAAKRKEPVETYLMERMKIPKKEVGVSLGKYYEVPFVEYSEDFEAPAALIKGLKAGFMRNHLWVPLRTENGKIVIAVDDPQNFRKLDEIKSIFPNHRLEFCVALKDDILDFITLFSEGKKKRPEFEVTSITDLLKETDGEDVEDLIEFIEEKDNTIAVLVNRIILDAHHKGASDIHIEPNPGRQKTIVRFRIDGRCLQYQAIPHNIRNVVFSRIKLMSNMNVMERAKPQVGKISFRKYGNLDIDLRVAVIPTREKMEAAALHILSSGDPTPLEKMGFSSDDYEKFMSFLDRPYGLIIVSGPAGSGKKTTLHSTLARLNRSHTKIWTAEDPVEVAHKGITQSEINPELGFDYPDAMRAILLADPDVIMIDNIKTESIASMAVDAALSGHLVLAGMHTDGAPDVVTELLEMGVNPRKLSNSFLCVLSQRLVRILCEKCKTPRHLEQDEYDDLVQEYGAEYFDADLNIAYSNDLRLFSPKGCAVCNNTGYMGRAALFELLDGTDELKRMVKMKLSADDLLWQAKRDGMNTIKQEGIRKIFDGLTDMSEVNRLCIR